MRPIIYTAIAVCIAFQSTNFSTIVENPQSDSVSFLDFVAVPNDPDQPCDEALKAARKASSKVRFPNVHGRKTTRYYLENSHKMKVFEVWEGDGKGLPAGGSAIVRKNASNTPFVTTNRSTIRDLCIVGDKDSRIGSGVELTPASHLVNVEVRKFDHGLVTLDNWQSSVTRSTFRNNQTSGVYFQRFPRKRNNIVTVRDCDMALNDYGVIMEGGYDIQNQTTTLTIGDFDD